MLALRHQQEAKVVLADAIANTPKTVTPSVALKKLSVARIHEPLSKVRVLRELPGNHLPHDEDSPIGRSCLWAQPEPTA